MRERTWRTGVLAALALVAGLPSPPARATIDLSGKWRIEYAQWNSVEFVDVTDVGGAVSTTLTPPLGYPFQFDGTFTEASLTLSGSLSGTPSNSGTLDAAVFADGNHFDGDIEIPVGGSFGSFEYRALGSRCECFDDNAVDGDGCDASCRVEPCFTCSGVPSTCTPKMEGAACEDGSPCTAGETCTGGTCGGGAPVAPCVDMTGLWDTTASFDSSSIPPIPVPPYTDQRSARVEQRGTTVLFRDASTGWPGFFGTIDPASGAFDLNGGPVHGRRLESMHGVFQTVSCDGVTTLAGTVAPDGESFSGTGDCVGCINGPVSETGVRRRCGDGTLDANELCDDNDAVSGDGCDANCTPTACGNGVVTDAEECDDGNTAGGDGCGPTCLVEPCWSCDAESPSACAVHVALVCSPPIDPHGVKLRVMNPSNPARAAIAVRWLRNATMADPGDPLATTSWDVCLLDRSGAVPGLVFAARVPAGGLCGSRPCWRAVGDAFYYKNTEMTPDGIKTLRLIPGTAGQAGVALQGKGARLLARPGALAALPLPLPLTLQVRAGGGPGCYGANFDAARVGHNDPATGRFRATATP